MVKTADGQTANEKNPVKESVLADKPKYGIEATRETSGDVRAKPEKEEATEQPPRERPLSKEIRAEKIQLDLERYRNIHRLLENKKYNAARLAMDEFLQRENESLSEPGYVIYLQNAYFYLLQKKSIGIQESHSAY